MSWWLTAGKIIVAGESLYSFASATNEVIGNAFSRGDTITRDDLRALWWRHLAETTCKYDLSLRELITALEPALHALERYYGYVPDIFPPLTKDTWRQLLEAGGCPPQSEALRILINVATLAASLLVAWGIARTSEK